MGIFLYQSMKLWIQKFTMKSKYFGWVFPVFPIKCVVVAKPYVGWRKEFLERIGTPGQVLRADIGSSSSKGVGGNEYLASTMRAISKDGKSLIRTITRPRYHRSIQASIEIMIFCFVTCLSFFYLSHKKVHAHVHINIKRLHVRSSCLRKRALTK